MEIKNPPLSCETRATLVERAQEFYWRMGALNAGLESAHNWNDTFEDFNSLLEDPELKKDFLLRLEVNANIAELLENFEIWSRKISTVLLSRTLCNVADFSIAFYKHMRSSETKPMSKRGYLFLKLLMPMRALLAFDDPAFRRMAYFVGRTRTALRFTPFMDAMPREWRLAMQRHWLRPGWDSAPQLPMLRWVAKQNPGDVFEVAGHCPKMSLLHHGGLICDGLFRKPSSLLYIGPHLVGALKWDGDVSMLALNNFRDAQGRLVIAEGMTYMVARTLIPKTPSWGAQVPDIFLPLGTEFPVTPLLSIVPPLKFGDSRGPTWFQYLDLLKDALPRSL